MAAARAQAPPVADPIRVMIVDDSALVRGLIERWLRAEPGFEVAGSAADGQAALDRLSEARPDIVLLDIEMPGLDGIQVLGEMLRRRPRTRVIMVSTATRRDAEISLRCLAMGAVDYVAKPTARNQLAGSLAFRRDLVACLHGLTARPEESDGPPVIAGPIRERTGVRRRGCIAIGASTGGPKAILELAGTFGRVADRAPILIAQHMPAPFTSAFAEQIARASGLPCAEARHGERIGPGRVYVAPGGRDMGLDLSAGETTIRLGRGAADRLCHPSVDVLFDDVARIYAGRSVGLVLSGMGTDGTEGARALAASGASVLIQDAASSIVWGMPGSVVRAGLATAVLSLHGLGAALLDAFGARP